MWRAPTLKTATLLSRAVFLRTVHRPWWYWWLKGILRRYDLRKESRRR